MIELEASLQTLMIHQDDRTHRKQVFAFADPVKIPPTEGQCAKVLVDGLE
jgi:hypothetical protein